MYRLRIISLALALLVCGRFAHAQTVHALVNESTIGSQEAVTYTIEISGTDFGQVSAPEAPPATGLEIVSRIPSKSTNVSWVNGNVTRMASFSWRYRPLQTGRAHIEPAEVVIAGVPYSTRSITVTVVPQEQRPAPARRRRSIFNPFFDPVVDRPVEEITERDVFIRATPSSTSPFVNEQVTISYELFFREGMQPRNSRLADSWDAEGFWREDLPIEGRPMPRTSIENGLRYSSILVKHVAVFPTRSGSLTVDPLRIATEVFSLGAFGFGSSLLSGSSAYQEIQRSSPPISMEVKPLPPNAPDGYRGAVGNYQMTAQLSRTQVDVGEPVELVIRISGVGNISTLEGPEVRVPGAFESYDPEVTTRNQTPSDLVRGTKTFSYLMVPRANGSFTIPPLRFSYLDPSAATYQTVERVLPAIRVVGVAPAAVAASTLATGFPVDDIAGPRPVRRWEAYPAVPLHSRWWIYVVLAVPLAALATLTAWRRRATRLETDVAWARNRSAHPLARRHLKKARQLYKKDEPIALFVELERAVVGFVGNRLNVAEMGMTRTRLDARLADARVPETTRTKLQNFLATCDAARFAPDRPDWAQMDSAMRTAGELIALIDQSMHT